MIDDAYQQWKMTARDLVLLQELKMNALSRRRWHLAAIFRNMERMAKKEIHSEYTEQLLREIEIDIYAEEKKNIL